jgi:hypothetical protein
MADLTGGIVDRKFATPDSYDNEFASGNEKISYQVHYEHYLNPETSLDRAIKEAAELMPDSAISSIEDCQDRARLVVQYIFEMFEAIKGLLGCHEELIRSRWLKKSRAQRKTVLLKACPHMSLRRLDLHAILRMGPQQSVMAQALSHINLEDLLQPRPLLLLLNARGRHLPETFAYADLELASKWKIIQEFVAKRKDNYTMAFLGKKSFETYGMFVKWSSKAAATESVANGLTVHVDHGLRQGTIGLHTR